MKPNVETTAAPLAVIGIDIGEEVFHLVGFGADGKIAFRRKIRRLGLNPDSPDEMAFGQLHAPISIVKSSLYAGSSS